jgi:glycosyltransferase involved in cell wall biosynthesis
MENSLVSILIPVYNRVSLVGESIDSAINQSYKDIEIIICDNCSTDGTWDVLQTYAAIDERIKIFRNEENIGPVRNWERCIQEANGEFSKILFSDDLIEPNYVAVTLNYLQKHPNVAFIFTPAIIKTANRNLKIYRFKYQQIGSTDYIENVIIQGDYPNSPGCALFRTKDLQNNLLIRIDNNLGLNFSNFGAGNDLLIFLLTALKYECVAYLNETYAIFREHSNSLTISNNLGIYYDVAKQYFIKEKYINKDKGSLLIFLKFKFLLYKITNKNYKSLYKENNIHWKIRPIIFYLTKRLINRCFRLF